MKERASLVVCGLLLGAGVFGPFFCSHQIEAVEGVCSARWTGYSALLSLLFSQSFGPLADLGLVSKRFQMIARRRFGITAALLSLVHFLTIKYRFLTVDLWHMLNESNWLRAGTGAFILMMLLWITSYPRFVKWFRVRNWQALHRFSYVACFFAVVHCVLSPWAQLRYVFILAGIWTVFMVWRLGRWSGLLKPRA